MRGVGPREARHEGYAVGVDDCVLGRERECRRGAVHRERHLVGVRGILGRGVGNVLDIDKELPKVFALVSYKGSLRDEVKLSRSNP